MPAQVGPYRIRQRLAEGAITSLYRAEHEKLGRIVLLKTLKESLATGSPLGVALDREAKILSKLGHSAIPRLLEVSSEGNATWVALENIEGPALATVLEKAERLEPASAAAIALEMAFGLAHVHARRFVHRSVEPRGIVISPDGRVALLDFSTAVDFDEKLLPSRFEVNETLRGPRYTAPEAILDEPAAPTADVFSLGVVLYEMLSGKCPWDEGNPTPLELSRRIRSEEPTPFAEYGVRIPQALSRIVWRCLAKRPEERYHDGASVAEALQEALDSMSNSPSAVLVTRALARANLGEVLVDERVRRRPKKGPVALPLRPLAGQLLSLFGLIVVGAVVIEGFVRERDVVASTQESENAAERGYLRVLARPWAEVVLDGRPVDVTPIARAIPVSAGRHYVTFKHPNAPDEKREIRVAPGQTVLVDVTMRVDRRSSAPKLDAGVDAPSSP